MIFAKSAVRVLSYILTFITVLVILFSFMYMSNFFSDQNREAGKKEIDFLVKSYSAFQFYNRLQNALEKLRNQAKLGKI